MLSRNTLLDHNWLIEFSMSEEPRQSALFGPGSSCSSSQPEICGGNVGTWSEGDSVMMIYKKQLVWLESNGLHALKAYYYQQQQSKSIMWTMPSQWALLRNLEFRNSQISPRFSSYVFPHKSEPWIMKDLKFKDSTHQRLVFGSTLTVT